MTAVAVQNTAAAYIADAGTAAANTGACLTCLH